jgi:hypothetical protein
VVNYLRACPLPEAKERLAELEKIDPKAVKRAATFFPIPAPSAGSKEGDKGAAPATKPGQAAPSNPSSSRKPIGLGKQFYASSSANRSDERLTWRQEPIAGQPLESFQSDIGSRWIDGKRISFTIAESPVFEATARAQEPSKAVFLLNSRIVFSVLACSVGSLGLVLWMISTGKTSS